MNSYHLRMQRYVKTNSDNQTLINMGTVILTFVEPFCEVGTTWTHKISLLGENLSVSLAT